MEQSYNLLPVEATNTDSPIYHRKTDRSREQNNFLGALRALRGASTERETERSRSEELLRRYSEVGSVWVCSAGG
jgi:hypothetical protein